MTKVKAAGISAHELVGQVYAKLCDKLPGENVAFKETARTEIGNDSDWHRTRVGYMGYDSVRVVKLKDKIWILGKGEACGQYPADPYDSDIFVFCLPEDRKDKPIEDSIRWQEYFVSSAFFAMSDGQVAANKDSEIAQKVLFSFMDEWPKYVIEPTKYRDDVIGLDLRPIAQSSASFKPELVEILVGRIVQAISE